MGKEPHPLIEWFYRLLSNHVVLLVVGGAVGTLLRYYLGRWLNGQLWTAGFPLGTFVINVTGSFVLGMAGIIIMERLPPERADLFVLVGIGFCGGYTTFSSFEWDTFKLIRDGSHWMALAYVLSSVLMGFVGVYLGVVVARLLFPFD